MDSEDFIEVLIRHLRDSTKRVPVRAETTVEDVIIEVCKLFQIGPVSRHLFALKDIRTQTWLKLSRTITPSKNVAYEFALRFNVPYIEKLNRVDEKAYDFYFKQAKHDLLYSKIPNVDYESFKNEILGMTVIDMCRAVIEDNVSRESVAQNYKNYTPQFAKKKHRFFLKTPIQKKFTEYVGRTSDVHFVKSVYLEQFKKIVPHYLSEEYPCLLSSLDSSIVDAVGITIRVSPDDSDFPGISYKLETTDKWEHVCKIEDLCYIISRSEGIVVLNRKNGIPMYLKFALSSHMESLLTQLDGYYRLMVKWTFNICSECRSRSLMKLLENKCHGPVSGEFSYKKLELKRNFKAGCFIIRESDNSYDTLYLDLCTNDNSSPTTFRIGITENGEYKLEERPKTYSSLKQLVADNRSGNGDLPLKECLPSSEYDDSNLLLCKIDDTEYGRLHKDREDDETPMQQPLCIDSKSLLVYKNEPKVGFNPHTVLYRAVWVDRIKNTRREVAVKTLKDMSQERLNEFLSLTSRWVCITSGAVTKLFGISLANPLAMVMEFYKDGQLDVYLSDPENRSTITEVNLVEASASLANALYYLEEAKFIHGVIRCRKLLVRLRSDDSFMVKLTDPGVIYPYDESDHWWIPPEFYANKDEARKSTNADVWAFGTTLYEIFSYGQKLPKADLAHVKKVFEQSGGLPVPANCPPALYRLMRECWCIEPDSRKQPQAIMRDINQIFYQIYNVNTNHYSIIGPSSETRQHIKAREKEERCSEQSTSTMNTIACEWDDYNSIDQSSMITVQTNLTDPRSRSPSVYQRRVEDEGKIDFDVQNSKFIPDLLADNKLSITSMQSIYELDKEWSVVFNGSVGEGFFGTVFRGKLMHMYGEAPDRIVAVKVLKSGVSRNAVADFDREIAIMRKLEHPNIIKFEGILHEPEYVLVMEFLELGQLRSYLNIHKDSITTHNLMKYALDVAKGMAYLSDLNIVHRDLAARNILVYEKDHVKISDFGLAQFIGDQDYYQFRSARELPIKWYAPEALEMGKFSIMSDVWSYGVTLYEMFSYGSEPDLPGVKESSQQALALSKGIRLPLPPKCSPYIYETLMLPCWEYEASKRPSFEKLRKIIVDDIYGGNCRS